MMLTKEFHRQRLNYKLATQISQPGTSEFGFVEMVSFRRWTLHRIPDLLASRMM